MLRPDQQPRKQRHLFLQVAGCIAVLLLAAPLAGSGPHGGESFAVVDWPMKWLWMAVTKVGLRRIGSFAQAVYPPFSDTVFHVSEREHPGVAGYVALTIDDGLCRQGKGFSMAQDVRRALRRHEAKATFFICSDYVAGVEKDARRLLRDGHELGNHCPEDRGYACMSEKAFEAALLQTADVLRRLERSAAAPRTTSWFRAPRACLSPAMHAVLQRHNFRHALADCFADDTSITDANFLAATLLKQVRSGSVIVVHMPEKGFREHTLREIELLLEGLDKKGLKSVTLSRMAALAAEAST
mmetsp:Transcript_11350/g.25341  ORF Transcript_11350/g.25341 Transcript_11350/m.25341 type:complete len:298 (-) Transcript_11350:148-1041(-)